jgi:hypothetical protein
MTTLRESVVSVDSLYLDPNNPRFADLQDRLQPIAPDRITEQGVQQRRSPESWMIVLRFHS